MKRRIRYQHDPPIYVPPHKRPATTLSRRKLKWRTITIYGKTLNDIEREAATVLVSMYGPGNVRVKRLSR